MEEFVRLHGTVRAHGDERRVFRRVMLVVEGKTLATVDQGEIEFGLFEGGSVVIEVPAEGVQLIDPVVKVVRGAWSELRELPEASGLARNAVAPFAAVEIHTVHASEGETVEVYGEAFDYEFDEATATLRDAPKRRPSRVLANIIAFGRSDEAMTMMRDAISKLRESRPKESPAAVSPAPKKDSEAYAVWIPFCGLGVMALLVLALLSLGAPAPQAWSMKMLALVFATLALVLRPTRDVPNFRAREKLIGGGRSATSFTIRLVLGVIPVWLSLAAMGDHEVSSSPFVSLVFALVLLFGWAMTEVLKDRDAHTVLATLVTAKRVTFADGVVGTCEATLSERDPVRVAGHNAVIGVVTEWDKSYSRRRADVIKSVKFFSPKRFTVHQGTARAEIDPNECVWASSVNDGANDPRSLSDYAIAEWFPAGGTVAIYGRFVRHEVNDKKKKKSLIALASIGTQPAILFATEAHRGPLWLASRIVWQRRTTLLIVALAACAVVALYLRAP